MYLFSRRVRLAPGNARDGVNWAVEMTERVNNITGLGIRLFQQVYSAQVGSIVWSAFVPDLTALEAATDKINADDGFLSAADRGAQLTIGGADDGLVQILHGDPDPSREVEYVTSVRAVAANGNLARALTVSVEIAQMAERIAGSPTLVGTDVTGTYGSIGWFTGHASIEALEAEQNALNADPSFLELIDREASTVYAAEPSLTQQRIFRRLT
jgi:hypothetical protein